jgi:hypothetical protein
MEERVRYTGSGFVEIMNKTDPLFPFIIFAKIVQLLVY